MRKWVSALTLVLGVLCFVGTPAHAQGNVRHAGCVSDARGAHHRPTRCTNMGTLMGDVLAGPTCPVERADHPCQPAPVRGAAVRIERPNSSLVMNTTTDAQGRFRATLAPGDYVVRVDNPGGLHMHQVARVPVRIAAGQVAHAHIMLDTGIR